MKEFKESSQKSAYLYAIKLLAKRDYSIYKLTNKLKERNYESDHISASINKIVDLGFLKEDLYIEARIISLMLKGLHPSYIQLKLAEEELSVSEENILEVFSQYPLTIKEQVQSLLTKKLPRDGAYKQLDNESKEKVKQRAYRHAISKGHDFSEVEIIFTELVSDNQ